MFGRKHPEVLVVGAGPVGLFTALVLAQRGVAVQIVDEEWRTGAHSYALALHPASLALLREVGLLDRVLEHATRVEHVGLYDATGRRAQLHFDALAAPANFVPVMRQDVLENLLEDALEEQGVRVQWNHRVARLAPNADHVQVTIERLEQESVGYSVAHTEWVVARTREMEMPYVLGADGHLSGVRRALGIEFPAVADPLHFAVFQFRTDADLGREMQLVFAEQAMSVCWPLPGSQCRWSFQLEDYVAPAASRRKDRLGVQLGGTSYPLLDEGHLHAFLAERAPWFRGSVEEVEWRIVVRFEHRLATSFGRGRVWLVGDAAHITGPAGIQSMNVGLREGAELAHVLSEAAPGVSPDVRLEAYGRERLREWQFLLGVGGGLRATPAADPWVAAQADRLLSSLPASGADLARLAATAGLEPVEPAPAAIG